MQQSQNVKILWPFTYIACGRFCYEHGGAVMRLHNRKYIRWRRRVCYAHPPPAWRHSGQFLPLTLKIKPCYFYKVWNI